MNEDKETRDSVNKIVLEGNVGNIGNIYENINGKKSLKFDLGQNNHGHSQFITITVKGKLIDTFANEIAKGDWITVKGRINSYSKSVENQKYKERITEILAFEIENHNKHLVYKSDGNVEEKSKAVEGNER